MNRLENGDRSSKFFFRWIKERNATKKVSSIWVDNKLINDPEEVKKQFYFYKNLFSMEEDNMQKINARNHYKMVIVLSPSSPDHEIVKVSLFSHSCRLTECG